MAGLTIPHVLRELDVPVPSVNRVIIVDSQIRVVQLRTVVDRVNPFGNGFSAIPFAVGVATLVVMAGAALIDGGIVEDLEVPCEVEHVTCAIGPLVAHTTIAGGRKLFCRNTYLESRLGD